MKLRSEGFSTSAYANRTVEQNTYVFVVLIYNFDLEKQLALNCTKNLSGIRDGKTFLKTTPTTTVCFIKIYSFLFLEVLDWKTKYDESENPFVRIVRGVTERVGHIFSKRFCKILKFHLAAQSEVSEVLTEIAKVDPSFDKHEWLRFCEKEVIPNILEAFIRADLDVLKDWCHELSFNVMSNAIKEYLKIGFSTADSRILDISKLEVILTIDSIIIYSACEWQNDGSRASFGYHISRYSFYKIKLKSDFSAFMINVVKNSEGKIVAGDIVS